MSEFRITEDNLLRFSKRIKKSIKTNLGQEITLTQAKLIISEMLGCNSIHQLQVFLAEERKIQEHSEKMANIKVELTEMLPNPDNLEIITLMDGYEKRYVRYAMVANDFIERGGLSKYINDPSYSCVNLYGETSSFFNDFKNAKEELLKPRNKNKMLLQYAVPALSHMVYQLPICGYYHMLEEDGTVCCYFIDN